MKKNILLIVSILILSVLASNILAQSFTSKSNVKADLKKLQDLYLNRDFNSGYETGKELIKKYPDSLEIESWTLINGARSDSGETVLKDAETFNQEKGENYWTLLALTIVQTYKKPAEAIATAEKLIKLSPNDEEAIFAYSGALFNNLKFQESLDLLVKNEPNVKNKSRFLISKATSTYMVEENKKDKANVQLSFDIFNQALKLTTNSVSANYLYATYLTRSRKNAEAFPFYKKAANLAPNVGAIQEAYWRAIKSQANKNDDKKEAEVEIAIDDNLKQTKNSPQSLLAAWKEYQNLTSWHDTAKLKHLQKKEQFEKQIIQNYPNTKYNEEVAFTQTRSIYGKYFGKDDGTKRLELNNKPESKRTTEEVKFLEDFKKKDELYKKEKVDLERAFLKRPQHFKKQYIGQVSLSLLRTIGYEKDTSDEEIANLIKLTLDHYESYWENLNTGIASILNRRTKQLPDSLIAKDAEKYARIGVTEAEKQVKLLPKEAPKAQVLDAQLNPLNVLANALIGNGKLDEAEEILGKISTLIDEDDSQHFIVESQKYYKDENLAQLHEARKDWDKAEEAYIKIRYDNENGKSEFEKFYEKRFGKKEGFDAYYAEIQKRLKIRAKERMAQSRIKNAQNAVPFSLKDLEDKTISSDDLKGKIVVINVWGTWCGPCVAEMNELQEFFDKYKDDDEVVVLTIDQGDELADVKKFMTDRKLTLSVLMDNDYLDKLPYFNKAFPTTFFIDKNGKVSFIKVGNSGNLVEEFSWRVDLLKMDEIAKQN